MGVANALIDGYKVVSIGVEIVEEEVSFFHLVKLEAPLQQEESHTTWLVGNMA